MAKTFAEQMFDDARRRVESAQGTGLGGGSVPGGIGGIGGNSQDEPTEEHVEWGENPPNPPFHPCTQNPQAERFGEKILQIRQFSRLSCIPCDSGFEGSRDEILVGSWHKRTCGRNQLQVING